MLVGIQKLYEWRQLTYSSLFILKSTGTRPPLVLKVARLWKFLSQMESGNMVHFAEVYIAQDKPNKAHTTILEKDPIKRVAN